MSSNPITQDLLRAYLMAILGDIEPKNDLSYRVRNVRPDEKDDAEGGTVAMDILVRGHVVETSYYAMTAEKALETFLKAAREEIKTSLAEAKDYIRQLADSASSSGILPN